MKKLEEYATPIVDKNSGTACEFGHNAGVIDECIARDLERRLAMCRDALRELTEECDYMKRSTEDWRPFHAAREQAKETLKATEPK